MVATPEFEVRRRGEVREVWVAGQHVADVEAQRGSFRYGRCTWRAMRPAGAQRGALTTICTGQSLEQVIPMAARAAVRFQEEPAT